MLHKFKASLSYMRTGLKKKKKKKKSRHDPVLKLSASEYISVFLFFNYVLA